MKRLIESPMSPMSSPACLCGGLVLTPDGQFERGDVAFAGDVIVEHAANPVRIDCAGYHVLPGIVDLHGDAFELELQPRPGVDIAFPIALRSVDRQLLSHGITTAFHGLTISWEPGARGLDAGRRFMAELPALRPHLIADHRVQLRWETFAHDAI
ncbi:MAG: alpha-D-ribose 1-methylphosphonate 5-triphosphate diphosphatase, partial [Pseudomonadota bacterium]